MEELLCLWTLINIYPGALTYICGPRKENGMNEIRSVQS